MAYPDIHLSALGKEVPTMEKAYKFRLYPTAKQEELIYAAVKPSALAVGI